VARDRSGEALCRDEGAQTSAVAGVRAALAAALAADRGAAGQGEVVR
jgi:hypothetical protein